MDVTDFQRGVIKLVQKIDPYADLGIMAYPDCSNALYELLSEEMNDDSDWIGYFCFDRDFGRNDTLGDITDVNGNIIPFKSIDDLWNILQKGEN
jgi:hypothetical protein